MFRGPTRGSDPGAAFSKLHIGTRQDGAGATIGTVRAFSGGDSAWPKVGLGNAVLIYARLDLLAPRDQGGEADIKYVDVRVRYFGQADTGATTDPRLPDLAAGTDLFGSKYYMNTDVSPMAGPIVLPFQDLATAGNSLFGTNALVHQWQVHRLRNPSDEESRDPFFAVGGASNTTAVIREIAAGDWMEVWYNLVPVDGSENAIMRVGESIQFAVAFGATARVP